MIKIPEHYVPIIQALAAGTGQATKHCDSLWLDVEQDQAEEQTEHQTGLRAGTRSQGEPVDVQAPCV